VVVDVVVEDGSVEGGIAKEKVDDLPKKEKSGANTEAPLLPNDIDGGDAIVDALNDVPNGDDVNDVNENDEENVEDDDDVVVVVVVDVVPLLELLFVLPLVLFVVVVEEEEDDETEKGDDEDENDNPANVSFVMIPPIGDGVANVANDDPNDNDDVNVPTGGFVRTNVGSLSTKWRPINQIQTMRVALPFHQRTTYLMGYLFDSNSSSVKIYDNAPGNSSSSSSPFAVVDVASPSLVSFVSPSPFLPLDFVFFGFFLGVFFSAAVPATVPSRLR
jgi:hypothetical protein